MNSPATVSSLEWLEKHVPSMFGALCSGRDEYFWGFMNDLVRRSVREQARPRPAVTGLGRAAQVNKALKALKAPVPQSRASECGSMSARPFHGLAPAHATTYNVGPTCDTGWPQARSFLVRANVTRRPTRWPY